MKKLKEERPVSPPPASALIQITQRQLQLEPEKVLSLFMCGVLCGRWKRGVVEGEEKVSLSEAGGEERTEVRRLNRFLK